MVKLPTHDPADLGLLAQIHSTGPEYPGKNGSPDVPVGLCIA